MIIIINIIVFDTHMALPFFDTLKLSRGHRYIHACAQYVYGVMHDFIHNEHFEYSAASAARKRYNLLLCSVRNLMPLKKKKKYQKTKHLKLTFLYLRLA